MEEQQKVVYVYKQYPSTKKAQKNYYEKVKSTDTYKEVQKKSSKSYYERNKEAIKQRNLQRYHQKKALESMEQEMANNAQTEIEQN